MESKKKKALILRTAKTVFAKYGYKKTTVEDISSELSMTKSNLYFYVKSKKDLYDQVVMEAMAQWYERVTDSLDGIGDLRERFMKMSTNAFHYLNEDEELKQIILKDPIILTQVLRDERYRDINLQSRDTIMKLIDEGKNEGVFRDFDTRVTADFFYTIYIMLLKSTLIGGDEVDGIRMFNQALEIIMHGLLKT